MIRKFVINRAGHVFADNQESMILAITIIDFDYETEYYFIVKSRGNSKRTPPPFRIYKDTMFKAYYDTWDEAHAALKERAAQQLKEAEQRVISATRVVSEVAAMTMPAFKPVDPD
jgi:hypothetical protein